MMVLGSEGSTNTAVGAGAGRRRLGDQAVAAATVVVLALIMVMINYLAFRHYERVDVTSGGMYTLSEKSLQLLRRLDHPVDIYLFMSRGEGGFEQTDELLKRYQAASPLVRVHYVDAEREEAEFRLLAQRFGILAGVTESGEVMADVAVVVTRDERNWHVSREDLLGFDMGPLPGEEEFSLNIKAEQALTGALLQVLEGEPTTVCVTEGHGEWSLEEHGERALSTLRFHLRHDNIVWQRLQTLGKQEITDACDAVLVLGPTRAFSPPEVELIDRYLNSGGNVLLGLDPVIERDEIAPTGFEGLLERRGVRLDADLVLEGDPAHRLGDSPAEFVVTAFGDHEVTRRLRGRGRVLLMLARSVSPTADHDGVTPLLQTTKEGYGETDLSSLASLTTAQQGTEDIEGPLTMAVAVRAHTGKSAEVGGRLAVVGDTDFLQGPLLDTPELANFDFGAGLIGFLTEREELIAIAPKKVKGGSLVLSQEDLLALFFRVTVLMPAAALVFGVGMWMRRRS